MCPTRLVLRVGWEGDGVGSANKEYESIHSVSVVLQRERVYPYNNKV